HRASKQIVAKGKSAFGVLAEDVDRQRLHQGMIKRFGLFQRLLGLLPLGNVTPSRDKVSDLAVAVSDRRDGLFLVKYLPVFPAIDELRAKYLAGVDPFPQPLVKDPVMRARLKDARGFADGL